MVNILIATVEQSAHDTDSHEGGPTFVDGQMLILVWVVFGLMAAILGKLLWKPVIQALDDRAQKIDQSIDNAERIESELASVEGQRKEIIAEADTKAKEIIETARRAAVDGARTIESKAREEAQIMFENASREINAVRDKAQASLRRESAEVAIALAGKIIDENLDNEKNRALTEKLISEI